MAKAKEPTKEQVRAARKQVREARRAMYAETKDARAILHAAARKRVTRGRFLRAPRPSRDFFVWVHDFHTMLESAARESDLPPDEMVKRAEAAADQMAAVIQQRNPTTDVARGMVIVHRSRRRRPSSEVRRWHEWQSMFDTLLHGLCQRTRLSPYEVILRAEAVTDLAQKVVDKRRPARA